MARIEGVQPKDAGLLTRIVYGLVRRKLAKVAGKAAVIEPIRITAHHPRLLRAVGQMEMGQEAAHGVPLALKTLAEVLVAMRIGCPF